MPQCQWLQATQASPILARVLKIETSQSSSILVDSLKFALEPGLRGLLVHAPEVIQAEPAKLDPLMAVR